MDKRGKAYRLWTAYLKYVSRIMGRYNPKFVEEEFNKFIAR